MLYRLLVSSEWTLCDALLFAAGLMSNIQVSIDDTDDTVALKKRWTMTGGWW